MAQMVEGLSEPVMRRLRADFQEMLEKNPSTSLRFAAAGPPSPSKLGEELRVEQELPHQHEDLGA